MSGCGNESSDNMARLARELAAIERRMPAFTTLPA
jgi:hypothetical protein